MPNVLFICSKNQWRSPTAQLLFKAHPLHRATSAGTSPGARIKVNEKLIAAADIIFVMERKHLAILRERFGRLLAGKAIQVLDITDEYRFNDPELIAILKEKLADWL